MRKKIPRNTIEDILSGCALATGPLDTPCWIWLGAIRRGYGWIGNQFAHAIADNLARGPMLVPSLERHHICETPACCNPAHIQRLTPKEHRLEHARLRRIRNPNCNTCGFPIGEDGRCKPCRNQARQIRYEGDPEKFRTRQRNYYATHPAYAQSVRDRSRRERATISNIHID
jgi:hypothetical protein